MNDCNAPPDQGLTADEAAPPDYIAARGLRVVRKCAIFRAQRGRWPTEGELDRTSVRRDGSVTAYDRSTHDPNRRKVAVWRDGKCDRAAAVGWNRRVHGDRLPPVTTAVTTARPRARRSPAPRRHGSGSRRSSSDDPPGGSDDGDGEADPEPSGRRCKSCRRPCRATERTCARCRKQRSRERQGRAEIEAEPYQPPTIPAALAERYQRRLALYAEAVSTMQEPPGGRQGSCVEVVA